MCSSVINRIMVNNLRLGPKRMLLAGLLASSIVIPAAIARVCQEREKTGAKVPAVSSPAASTAPTSGPSASSIARDTRSPRAAMMYRRLWGIDDIHVRETASGSLIKFSYRVLDATKAQVLNDNKVTPYLIDGTTGAKLGVPETEKVGKLRQVATPQNGREYWMVFLNQGRFVKPGNRVNVVIGTFHANGLLVESPLPTLPVRKPKE